MQSMSFTPITVDLIAKGLAKPREKIDPFSITEIVIEATGVTRFIPKDLMEFLMLEEKRFEHSRLIYLMIHISILVLVSNTLKKNDITEPSLNNKIKESWEELLGLLEKHD